MERGSARVGRGTDQVESTVGGDAEGSVEDADGEGEKMGGEARCGRGLLGRGGFGSVFRARSTMGDFSECPRPAEVSIVGS
jgi:hypothetical protein